MDRLRSMQIFVRVVQMKGFTAAADGLGITPQMVGNHVKFLEEYLGFRLINRTTRRVGLTEVGRLYFEHCLEILDLIDSAEADIREMRSEPRGLLRITAPLTFGTQCVAPALVDFTAQYPRVEVDLTLSDNVQDLISSGFEVAIRIGSIPDSSLIARPLRPYRMMIAAAPGYLARMGVPERVEDLSGHECLGFRLRLDARSWRFLRPDGDVLVPVRGRISIDNGQALRKAALAGLGIVMQPEVLLADDVASGQLVRLFPGERLPERPISLVYRSDRQMTPKLRAFVDFALGRWKEQG